MDHPQSPFLVFIQHRGGDGQMHAILSHQMGLEGSLGALDRSVPP
jgi:hypothetical protein